MIILKELSTKQLLELYSKVMADLRRRDVVRSSNNPVADYAEHLVCKALGLERAPRSAMGHDGLDSEGRKYEVKARRLTAQNPSRQLSVLRGLQHRHFDFLAGVLFDEDFHIQRACLLQWDLVEATATHRDHVNGCILHLRDSLWNEPGARDITEELREAAVVHP